MTRFGLSGPVYAIQGSHFYSVGDAFSAVDGKLGELDFRVNRLEEGDSAQGRLVVRLRSVAASTSPQQEQVAALARQSPPSPASAPASMGHRAGGAAPADAVSTSQVQEAVVTARQYADEAIRQASSEARAYTDQRVAALVANADFDVFKSDVTGRFRSLSTRLHRVGAMGTALAGMAGAVAAAAGTGSRISAAVGGYRGQGALALGFAQRIPGNGAVLLGGSLAGGGESSGTLGVSFGW